MNARLVFLAFAVCCPSHLAAHSLCPEPDRSALEAVVSAAVAQCRPDADSGIALSVVTGTNRCYFAFGLRDRQSGARVEPGTFFPIGSATKSFTSMALSMLAEQGDIRFDQPILGYLPEFAMHDANAGQNMTLEDILSHRTGLPRHDLLWYLGPFSSDQLFYRVRHLSEVPEPHGFRRSFQYNNLMVTIAGLVLEAKSQKPWDVFIRERILNKLGMMETDFAVADLAKHANYAKGYLLDQELKPQSMAHIRPAAEINSNVLELTNWVILHLKKGNFTGRDLLISEASLENMYTGRIDLTPDEKLGLGWFVRQIQGKRLINHGGTTEGYSSFVSFMPDQGLGLVALSNQQPRYVPGGSGPCGGSFPDRVAAKVYDHLLNHDVPFGASLARYNPELPDRAEPVVPLAAGAPPPPPSPPPGDYVGLYSNPGYGDMVVRQVGSNLVLSYYRHSWPLARDPSVPSAEMFKFPLVVYGEHLEPRAVFQRDAGKVSTVSITLYRIGNTSQPVQFLKR